MNLVGLVVRAPGRYPGDVGTSPATFKNFHRTYRYITYVGTFFICTAAVEESLCYFKHFF